MNRTLLVLMTGLVLLGGVGEVTADGHGNETAEPEDDGFNFKPFLVLILIAAVVLAIAKYGP